IFRDSIARPGLQRPRERFLNNIFRKIEMLDAKDSGENGNHFRPLVAKKMFHYAGYLRWYLDSIFQEQFRCTKFPENSSIRSAGHSERSEEPTIAARVAQDNHNVRTSSALPHFV